MFIILLILLILTILITRKTIKYLNKIYQEHHNVDVLDDLTHFPNFYNGK